MSNLDDAITTAKRVLAANRDGALERGYREQIWSALGPRDADGRARRASLAIATVMRALPVWFARFPNDDTPRRLLDEARGVLAGRGDVKRAARERDRAWTRFDDLAADGGDAVAVGYASAQALSAALYDEEFSSMTAPVRLDADVSPESHDASYLISVAEAGGPAWQPSDPSRRRAFWRWWLDVAVPEVA